MRTALWPGPADDGSPARDAPLAAVAIPARDEARRLGRCLAALAGQRDAAGRPLPPGSLEVVLLLNNCRDRSFEAAEAAARRHGLRLRLVEVELAPGVAHVGWARRLAMDAAAARLGPGGVVLTTDADSCADATWVDATLRAVGAGADAVAGRIEPEPAELRRLPAAARRRLALERAYDRLLDRLSHLLDPEPHDPWPRHSFHCGATLAARVGTYVACGRLPPVPASEDRAFFAAVRRIDGRIRHCPEVRVVTSCRTAGRAPGGMADALRRWSEPDPRRRDEVDAALPAFRALRLRADLRAARAAGGADPRLAARLGLDPAALRRVLSLPSFGRAAEAAGAACPALRGRPVDAGRIEAEIRIARRLLRRVKDGLPASAPHPGARGRAGTARPDLAEAAG